MNLPSSPIRQAATQVLNTLVDKKKASPRLVQATIVVADHNDIKGALEMVKKNPAAPMLICYAGRLENSLKNQPEMAYLSKFPNVRFVDTARFVVDGLTVFSGPKEDPLSPSDRQEAANHIASVIRHDLGHALSDNNVDRQKGLIGRAREQLGLVGNDEAIIKAIMERNQTVEVSEFREVNGCFVDWDGTLKKDGKFDRSFFDFVSQLAQEKGLPLAVWTGGDPDAVYRELARSGIEGMHACSKHDCKGLRVSLAIDDTPLEELRKTYGVDAKEFQNIQSIL